MRIVGGKFKGRRFNPPAKNWPTRPTTDYSKEALFNILQNRFDFEDLKVLDLFGGTGNHSYEFISRGCQDVTYVDKFYGCVQFVRKLSKELGIEDHINICKTDVFKYIKFNTGKFDYIFAGPPYPLKNIPDIPELILEREMLTPDGLLVLETNPDHDFTDHPNCNEVRKYGQTTFSFFQYIAEKE